MVPLWLKLIIFEVLGVIWIMCGSKCRGRSGGIYICVEFCLVKSCVLYGWVILPGVFYVSDCVICWFSYCRSQQQQLFLHASDAAGEQWKWVLHKKGGLWFSFLFSIEFDRCIIHSLLTRSSRLWHLVWVISRTPSKETLEFWGIFIDCWSMKSFYLIMYMQELNRQQTKI